MTFNNQIDSQAISQPRTTKWGLVTAGVLLGLSAGVLSAGHQAVHADTVDNANKQASATTEVKSPYQDDPNITQATNQAKQNDAQGYLADHNSASDQASDDSSTDDQKADEHKVSVKFQFPDGEDITDLVEENRADKAEAVYEVVNHPYKAGDSVNLINLNLSTYAEYDVTKVTDQDGNVLTGDTIKMPDHDLQIVVTMAPTGDDVVMGDKLTDKLKAYTKEHGLPDHILHQAYGGKTQEEMDEIAKKQEKENQAILDDLNKNKNKGNQTSDQVNTSKDDTGKDDTKTNSKKVTLTFIIRYNGAKFGKVQIKDLTPGSHYHSQELEDFQNQLKNEGNGNLTLSPTSLKMISGTVPDEDKTVDLTVVDDSGKKSQGQGKDVGDAVSDSLGDNGTAVEQGSQDDGDSNYSNGDDTPLDSSEDTNDDSDESTPADDSQNADQANSDQPGQGNNQQLPQTGAHANVALLAIGLSTLALGTGLLIKKRQTN